MTGGDKATEGDMRKLEVENQGVKEASWKEEDRDTSEETMVGRKDLEVMGVHYSNGSQRDGLRGREAVAGDCKGEEVLDDRHSFEGAHNGDRRRRSRCALDRRPV
jgi:hypothetical protein